MELDVAYGLLGITRGAPLGEARAQFRRRAKIVHPDHGGAAPATAQLLDAWRVVQADLHRHHGPPPPRRPAEHECEVCGTNPAANLTLRRAVGLLVVSPVVQARARVCRGCARSAAAEWQALTLLRGWWSIFGVVVTPFVFLTNVGALHAHRRRTTGPQRRDPHLAVPQTAPTPYRSPWRPAVIAACLAAGTLVALIVVAVS